MPRTIPSQRDIAARAGVSQSAVSFVLNGRSDEMGIPRTTQERIRRATEELKYVPNVAARALRGARNDLIGVYTYERVFPLSPNDYYNEFLHGIEEGAVALGLDLVLFTSAFATAEDGAPGVYRGGSNRLGIADGTVMLGTRKSDEELARLADEGYPFVFVGRRDVPGVLVPCVTADYYSAMSSVVELLASFGHDRVLYLGGLARARPERERLNGYEHFALQSGLQTSTIIADPAQIDEDTLHAWIREGWTAVVAETSEMATRIIDAARSADVAIPDNLSLVALDVGVLSPGVAVSHVEIPRRAMGREAVSLLSHLINDGALPSPTVTLPCSSPTSSSVAPAPGRRRSPSFH